MALKITDECISCNACESECPNNAIYEGGVEWAMADGNTLKGNYTLLNGVETDVSTRHVPISTNIYYIVPDKCTECKGFHETPQCAEYCPVDRCMPDEVYQETVEELLAKKEKMHL